MFMSLACSGSEKEGDNEREKERKKALEKGLEKEGEERRRWKEEKGKE